MTVLELTVVVVVVIYPRKITTSHLKNASNAQLRCCEPPQNAHILHVYAALFHRLAPCP